MPDPRFFKKAGPFSLKQIADLCGASIAPAADPDYIIQDVAALDKAGAQELSFLDNVKYKTQFLATKAGACIVLPELADQAPKNVQVLTSRSPYKSYALAAQALYPPEWPETQIAKSAHISDSAKIGAHCTIGENAVILENAEIGDHCWIEAGAIIGASVSLGQHCRIGVNAAISHAIIGDHVRLYPGVRVGQDGFGFAIDPAGHVKVPQLGRVIIEDHVEIGANTCIDRGSGPDTVIGQGTWIDNLVQIGHNVKIGKGCIIVSQAGVSGSTVLGNYVALGGQVGIAGHLHIGDGAQVAAKSGVMRDIPTATEYMGYPARPIKEFMRQVALLNRLIKKGKSA